MLIYCISDASKDSELINVSNILLLQLSEIQINNVKNIHDSTSGKLDRSVH